MASSGTESHEVGLWTQMGGMGRWLGGPEYNTFATRETLSPSLQVVWEIHKRLSYSSFCGRRSICLDGNVYTTIPFRLLPTETCRKNEVVEGWISTETSALDTPLPPHLHHPLPVTGDRGTGKLFPGRVKRDGPEPKGGRFCPFNYKYGVRTRLMSDFV